MPSAYLAANIPGEPPSDETGLTANIDPQKAATPLSNAQLMPADPQKGYATPYYAAYTNDGDFAGAVMVADGQKVRLVDKMSGEVVFEGVGPAAAQTATAVANSISKEQGRTAAWAIQKPSEEGGWVSMAEERWDPKKQSLLGKVADFALPIIGAILAPGIGLAWAAVGSAAGSALSSVAQGRSLEETVKRAALSAGLTYVGGTAVGKLGKVLANSDSAVGQALYKGYSSVMNPVNAGVRALETGANTATNTLGTVAQAGANTIKELVVQGGRDAATGALFGAGAGGGAGGVLKGSSGQNTSPRGGDTGANNAVDTLDVTPANDGGAASVLTAPLTVGDYTQVGSDYKPADGRDNVVDELVVTGARDYVPVGGPNIDPTQLAEGVRKGIDYEPPTSEELLEGKPGLSTRLLEWAKANPELAAKLGLNLASLLGGAAAGGGSTTGGGIPPGFATAGTPGSLSDKFRAQLPAPSGPFGNLAARDVSMTPEEWKTYGARPEQSFFANVPIRPSGIIEPPARRAPVTPGPSPAEAEPGLRANIMPGPALSQPGFNPTAPSSVNSTSGSDMNRGSMTAEQFAVAMKRMEDARRAPPLPAPSKGFKVGGFAVRGPGTGRSDDIPARLSDGEYVIDAETVALLGDGSSQAGSKRLDEFRANIRKHKGRQLAKGKFSHNARKPEAYLHGGRV